MANVLQAPIWTKSLKKLPVINHQTIHDIANQHSKTPQTSLQKGYRFFSGSYVHDFEGKFSISEPGSSIAIVLHSRIAKFLHIITLFYSTGSDEE